MYCMGNKILQQLSKDPFTNNSNKTPNMQEISFTYVSRKARNMSPNSIIKSSKFHKKVFYLGRPLEETEY